MPAPKTKPRKPRPASAKPRPRAPPKKVDAKPAAKARTTKATAPTNAKTQPRGKRVVSTPETARRTPPPVDVAEDSPASWIAETAPEAGPPAPSVPPTPPAQAWIPILTPAASRPARSAPAFDPATGAWLPAGPTPAAVSSEPAPDSPKPTSLGSVLWTILLWIDLVALAVATVASIVAGLTLAFSPDSAQAEKIRDELTGGTVLDLVLNTVAAFVAFGLVPLLWVRGTRRDPREGTRRFLHLHGHQTGHPAVDGHAGPGDASIAGSAASVDGDRQSTGTATKTILLGVLLAALMVVGVAVLVTTYTLLTEGVDALTSAEEEPNPAVQGILDNLSWPMALLVAAGAGIGEEIFFRGFLQRYLGVWGQAVLFGLAHATGGYLPQVAFALGMGLVFGYLIQRGWSLWTLMVAHFLYDFTLLALALVAPGLG
ncbi:MAG TPA: CPBP family glutamic-type intramembrane protease [Candidatus Thermoplasmatota archaeon]|nr:CPBP family glutamic-type intramembrane protease [Candidatus Thermoplasmatota archaeon]